MPGAEAGARELVAIADIVVENFRAGTMERFGLDYETLRASKPDLIYCSITGFGRERGAALPGYDLRVHAVGGPMSVTGPGPDEPTKVGVALVDVLAGLHALVGILAALAHRHRTGQGQRAGRRFVHIETLRFAPLTTASRGIVASHHRSSMLGERPGLAGPTH
jgi:crotonobetainyl-CoA:carnitine CoA-transferase CaiB-like acyl-CoA transferase